MDSVRLTDTRLWPSCTGFRNFAVNEVHVGSIPIGHPLHAAFEYWLGRLSFEQQEGDRNSHAVLASNEATLWRGRF